MISVAIDITVDFAINVEVKIMLWSGSCREPSALKHRQYFFCMFFCTHTYILLNGKTWWDSFNLISALTYWKTHLSRTLTCTSLILAIVQSAPAKYYRSGLAASDEGFLHFLFFPPQKSHRCALDGGSHPANQLTATVENLTRILVLINLDKYLFRWSTFAEQNQNATSPSQPSRWADETGGGAGGAGGRLPAAGRQTPGLRSASRSCSEKKKPRV